MRLRCCNIFDNMYSVCQKISPEVFWQFFTNGREFLINFLCTYYRPIYFLIYARLQIVIELSPSLTKFCHTKRYYLVHICSKCPSSAETHAFRRLRKSSIALLIVVCGKSSQICCSILALRWCLALTEVCEMLEASHPHTIVVDWIEIWRVWWPLVLCVG